MTEDRKQASKRFWTTDWFLGLVVAAVVLVASQIPSLPDLERFAYDLGLKLASRSPGNDVVVVEIDSPTIREFGALPWSPDLHAELIGELSKGGAKVIGYDLDWGSPKKDASFEALNRFLERSSLARQAPREIRQLNRAFDQLRNRATLAADRELARELEQLDKLYRGSSLRRKLPGEIKQLRNLLQRAGGSLNTDEQLVEQLQEAGNVVLRMPVSLSGVEEKSQLPPYVLRDALAVYREDIPVASDFRPPPEVFGQYAWGIGFSPVARDTPYDGTAVPLFVRHDKQLLPSFPLVLATRFFDATGRTGLHGDDGVDIGRHYVATDGQLRMLSFYYGPQARQEPFERYSFRDVVQGRVPLERFRDKLVLVGAVDGVGEARYRTPHSAALPAVLTAAHNTASILNRHFISIPQWAEPVRWGAFLLTLLFVMSLLPRMRLGMGMVATLILLNVLVDTHFLLLMNRGLWVPLMNPALLLILAQLLFVAKRGIQTYAIRRAPSDESAENTRMLGLAFQGQGQLDMAFEKFRKCPLDDTLMDVLYNLAADYERKRQYGKAGTVYEYMAQYDPDYKDIAKRSERARKMEETGLLHHSGPAKSNDTILLDVDGVQKPMLGRYQVERVIGRGAMGVIYQGRDPKINRVVAIKTLALAQEFEGGELEEVERRFFREAETAGRLNHPNIVTIYDAGEEQDLAYIAMEFLTGHDLTRYCKPDKLLPLPAVFHIAIKAAEALDYAHSQNVVHRDIKPGNIIFESKSGDVKITDFGIARITDSSKTRTGTVLGTPAYMSPEQLAGERIDGRSDLFSLGVMFYQLVTGELPFQADSMASLMFKITNEAHLPVVSHNADLDPCIDAIIDKALSKQIKWRYQSGAEFARDLRACARKVMARTQRETKEAGSR
ncbi:MAG: hypothetical protein Kow006_05470 [Gammaproteobacteria bacterium]